MIKQKIKGRGAQLNPKNRFEKLHVENFEYDQDTAEEEFDQPKKIKTIFYKDDSKSIIATLDGSIARSFRPSGSILKVASSTRMEMAVAMSLRSLASDTLSLNIAFFLSFNATR